MLKINFKILLIIILTISGGYFLLVYKDSQLTGVRAPYIQLLSSESVVIQWLTIDNQQGVVRFGQESDDLATIAFENLARKNHLVKLSNLQAGRRYYYQTGKVGAYNAFHPEKHWFYTHPKKVQPLRIWVIGDSGSPGETLYQVKDKAIQWMKDNPQAIYDKRIPLINVWIALGDLAYRSGSNQQFQNALFDPFADILANTMLWPVYGNHDDRRWTYFKIFTLPENAESGGIASFTENYYSFDYANVHFVMLDSQASDRSANAKMANWLINDLAHNTKPWLIAAFHHPPYSKGSHNSDDNLDSFGRMKDMRENFLPILEQAGVDLVLSGHSHLYERSYLIDCAYQQSSAFSSANIVSTGLNNKHQNYIKSVNNPEHQGAIYIVAGSASKVDDGPLGHPAHHKSLLEAGSLVIDINNNELIARFINHQGIIRDKFSIRKKDHAIKGYQGCKNTSSNHNPSFIP